MNKRLWSGVMAGIMAVSSSIVLELPAAAQDYELMQTTLGDWQAQGQTIALGGIATSSSTIRITCTAPAGLTEDVLDDDGNKTGETKTPEEVCGIIFDSDWSSVIPVAYNSETGITTYTLTYDQFSGKRTITIQNHTHSDIQVTVEAVDFDEDTREAPSTAAITDNIALTISTDDNSGWLEGNIASTPIPDSVLTERFKGKTVGEFRAAVGKVYTPAVNYISDTAGAGKDAFAKMFYIGCDNAQFTTSDAQMAFALDEEGVTFINGMFPDDSNDSLIIEEIGTSFETAYEWDGDINKNHTKSEVLNALPKGYNLFIETTEDDKETLELPAASGTITMGAYTDESNSWLYGASAGGSFAIESVDGITYGTTTMKEFRDKYKYIKLQDLPFFASSIESLTGDQLNQNVGFEFADGSYLGLRSSNTNLGNLYGIIPDGSDDDISNYDDKVISKINIDINVNTNYDEEKQLNVSVNSDVSALSAGDKFTVELTEDTRSTLDITAASGEVDLYAYIEENSDWYEGVNAGGFTEVAAPEGITYGETTLKQLMDGYKTLNIPEVPFFSCSLDGVTADDLMYTFNISLQNGDDNRSAYYDASSLAATNAPVDGMLEEVLREISNPEDYVISGMNFYVRAKNGYNSETGKHYTLNEAIKSLNADDVFTVVLTQDTRGELNVPAISAASAEMYVYTDDSWLEGAAASVGIAVDVDGIENGKTTIKDLREKYKVFNAAAQTYYGDSVDAGADAFVHYVKLITTDPSDGNEKHIFPSNKVALTSDGVFRIDDYDSDGQTISSGALDSYVIERVELTIDTLAEYDESTGKSYTTSEAIRGLSDGSNITLEFREDTRKNVELEPIASTAYMYTRNDENAGGMIARADYEYSGCEIIGKTVSELLADYKSVSIKAPGYFADSVGAKADAYNYRIEVVVDNDEGTDTQWLGWYNNALDEDFTLKFSTYYSILEGKDDYKVTSVNVVVETKNGENGAVSEVIRSLPENSLIVLEFKEDTRVAAKVVVNPYKQVYASYQQDDNTDGACAHASMPADEFSGEYVGMTLAEFKKAYKTLSTDKITFTSDTEGYSAEDYTVKFYFVLEKEDSDDVWRFADNSFGFNTAATSYTDMIDETDTDGYKIAEIGAFIESRKEETEDGKLRAVNEKMRGGELNTLYIINPQSVKNLKATAGDKTLTLTWDAVDYSGVSYKVYMIQDGERIYCSTSETNSVTVTDLENDKEYTFAIGVVMNETEYVDESNTVTASPRAKLPAPSNVKATAGDKQITVTWDKLDGAVQYRVQRLNGTSWGTVATTSSTSYTNTGLVNGQTYSYRVLASDGTTWGTISEVVSAAPKAGTIPQNVKATAGDKQVTITWSAVENATQYRVQRLNNSTWGTAALITATSYTNTGLTNGASYSYRVLALVDGKWSSASAVVSAKPTAPTVPQNVKATAGDKKVTITWSAFSGATQYRVQRLNNSTWSTVANVTSTSYTNTGLTNGTSYSYRVLAYANGKWTSASAVVSAKPTAPTVPQNVKATAGDKKVTITWSAFSGATQYRVQRLNNSTWSTVANVTSTSYTNTGLTNGTSYSYRVLAYANGKWTSASAVVSAKPTAPTVPQNVKATAGDKKVTITWSAFSGATQYRVQRLNNSTWSTVANVTSTSYTNTGLTNGTSYSYRVLAYANGKWTSASAVVSAKPTAPTVPQNVKATAGDKKVTITWSAFSGATQYRVQRLNNSTWGTVANVTSTSYTNTGLTNGTSYSYRVLAYVNGKWTSASAAVSAKPAASVPQNVKATAGDKKVTVTWSALSGATQYRVQRLNNSTWGTVANVTSTSYTNTGLTNGTSYSYRVLAYVNGKWTSASAAVSATPKA